ncbi:MAG: radical SAM protein [Oscillospiraceae bacterium]|nr:radical SAM protein [Oscillospiraceae bacterium]
MKDYIQIIADKINSGTPVVFYTVGGDTFSMIRLLKKRFNLKPVAVCDKDVEKQGRNYHALDGIPVISFDEANTRYPNAEYFISSMNYRFEIMAELINSKNLPIERIINYEPLKKRKSCTFFERSVFLKDNGDLIFCCVRNSPSMKYDECYDSYTKNFLKFRNEMISACENGGLPDVCANCGYLKEAWYPEKPMSWWVNWFVRNICNYKCKYCKSPTHTMKDLQGLPEFGKTIEAFQNAGVLSDFYSVILSTSGEPTLSPKRKDFYDSFNGYALFVNTNGSNFDRDLFQLMQDKIVMLVVSIDAGTSETYKEIKGVDSFDKVIQNLQNYMQACVGYVVPKYIFMPGINDNEIDVDGFADICDRLSVPYAIIAYDQRGVNPIPDKTIQMMRRLQSNLENNNILCVPYTPYETYEYVAALTNALSS